MLDPVPSLMLALFGALLFGSAALHKARSLERFATTLARYRIPPISSHPMASYAICLLEFAACFALLWPRTRPVGAAIGAALLLAYAGALTINLLRGRRDLDCGCGLRPTSIGGWMVIRNLSLAALLGLLFLPSSPRSLETGDYVTVAGGIIISVLLYLSAEMLFARPARDFHGGKHA